MWLDTVKKGYGDDLQITWRHFSLEQNSHDLQAGEEDDGWKVWEQPDDYEGRSILALRAAEAAKRQGPEAFEKFHLALLKARHGGEGRVALNEVEPLAEVARDAGLDEGRFREDLKDRDLLENVGRDHAEAVENGVFGTPTFVFENSNAAFVKTFIPPEEDRVAFFEHFAGLFNHRPYLGEIKRPQPPWPRGAV